MKKYRHEIRDPIHTFIKLTSDERKVLDSRPFQRLRNINQLAFTYLVYPGATHKRFEHSLGVMELSTRIFDKLIYRLKENQSNILQLPPKNEIDYWRQVLRMAALCHDIGHLPFSHAAEKELFPDGWNHERMTVEIIKCEEMEDIWNGMTPPIRSNDIVKLAVGSKELSKYSQIEFKPWETILSEIIVSDTFGADRMDYLLRDSYHAGVVYGKFGYYRLIDTLSILPYGGEKPEDPREAYIGIESGGLQSAEALLLARYFMFSQLYLHSVRRIYDLHLKDFLMDLFPNKFPINVEDYLQWTDNEILVKIYKEAFSNDPKKNSAASIITNRCHYKLLYERFWEDIEYNLSPGEKIYKEACSKYGADNLKYDSMISGSGENDFPVIFDDGRIASSLYCSEVIKNIPRPIIDNVYICRDKYNDAHKWIEDNRKIILSKNN